MSDARAPSPYLRPALAITLFAASVGFAFLGESWIAVAIYLQPIWLAIAAGGLEPSARRFSYRLLAGLIGLPPIVVAGIMSLASPVDGWRDLALVVVGMFGAPLIVIAIVLLVLAARTQVDEPEP